MKYKLAVFDMDGTILNTLDDLTDGINYTLQQYSMPPRSLNEVKSFVGNGIPLLCERAVAAGTDKKTLASFTADFTAYYKDHCAIKTCVYEGIAPLLECLRSKNILTAVVSNKDDEAVKSLCKEHFLNMFDYELGRCDGLEKKPAPDMVLKTLAALKIDKDQAVYIGDSDVDFLTAKNSDLAFIGVTWGFRTKEFLSSLGAKTLVDRPSQILEIILG